jgi:microcystin-dependent protein
VTLTSTQISAHTHSLIASTSVASDALPTGNIPAQASTYDPYVSGGGTTVSMSTQSISAIGGSQPHSNMQPYLCVSFIISLFGIYPSPA